jgi:hypothetical protein
MSNARERGHEKIKRFETFFDNAWTCPNKELATKGATVVATHCENPTGSGSNCQESRPAESCE